MGQSSFTDANDKNRSIAQSTSEHPDSEKTAYFLLPGGNKVEEVAYDGYCYFGNIDAFEWLAETNGLSGGRNAGVRAFYSPEVYQTLTFPLKITYDPDATYEQSGVSFDCPHQGLPPRPDKAIAFAAGADPFLVDDEVFDDVFQHIDCSEPSTILAIKLTSSFTDSVPNLSMMDESILEDPDARKILMDTVFASDKVVKLQNEEPHLPSRENLEALVELIITECEFDGASYSPNVFYDALIYAIEVVPTPAAEIEPQTPDEPGVRPKR